ncbi:hypothetical protein GCM10007973_02490 [Polymorphobacter multimanifer]|uniref:Uncharacterized protein n=1 Tax=Polymorphobacter multimanifer TaxID=1070431 RepID=A0A841LHF5_9SPHN|nr:hypothetical protein [Polymorphobacter multimanifer]MBB6228632.1 hypothetical protein [Polymorphobacter multimanifer]GGI68896.1 hypothetical protein GCM10007973_02490 [Polymorphobacter multimanifer]
MKTFFAASLLAATLFMAQPALAQGMGHTFIMRGQVVGMTDGKPVVCIGKADGAKVGQVLDTYRVTYTPGSSKSTISPYRREKVGQVTINDLFDDHFAHATVTSGAAALHDIVETKSQ